MIKLLMQLSAVTPKVNYERPTLLTSQYIMADNCENLPSFLAPFHYWPAFATQIIPQL